jgi:hypothetical protein
LIRIKPNTSDLRGYCPTLPINATFKGLRGREV